MVTSMSLFFILLSSYNEVHSLDLVVKVLIKQKKERKMVISVMVPLLLLMGKR